MAQILRNRTEIEQELILQTDLDEAISYDSESELEEDTVAVGDNNNVTQNWLRPQHPWNSGETHPFIGGTSGLKTKEAPYVNNNSSPTTTFYLFFMHIQLLVAETNKYYNQHLDTLDNDDGHSQLPDVTVQKMYVFLALTIHMGHDKWDTLKDYWSTLEQLYVPFYSNMMKQD
jgi:hypothetical protein